MLRRLSALFALLALPLAAQFSSAIQGTVLDPSAAAVPNATVTLRNARTGITADVQTTSAGFYRFSALAPGSACSSPASAPPS